jgi:hypothetical protein
MYSKAAMEAFCLLETSSSQPIAITDGIIVCKVILSTILVMLMIHSAA